MKRFRLTQRRKAVGLSQERLAELIRVDTSTVRRWEAGTAEPQPWLRPRLAKALAASLEDLAGLLGDDQSFEERRPARSESHNVLAAVLGNILGIPPLIEASRSGLRGDELSAHLHPLVAGRTLEELEILVRSDMLTRRETLTEAMKVLSGPALLVPIAHWLGTDPAPLEARDHGTQHIGASDVEAIERSTRFFAATDAEMGGALSREAAVGQLKYAVDLARHANYSEAVGNRLLAVIAELSGLVGWLCHDSAMPGPAQRYFMYGLQAARESADPRARLLVVSILADMGEHARWQGRIKTAFQLQDLALDRLPSDPRLNALRGVLIARRVENALCHLGPSHLPEVRNAMHQAFDLCRQSSDEDRAAASTMWHRVMDISETELSMSAAVAYLVLAEHNPRLAAEAETYTLDQIAGVPDGQGRSKAFGQIRLARIRFLAGEVEQACEDGAQALDMAGHMKSTTMQIRLRELLAGSEPYARVPRVVEFRDQLQGTIGRLN